MSNQYRFDDTFDKMMENLDECIEMMHTTKTSAWKKYFAWRPVQTISGETVWMTSVYRREVQKSKEVSEAESDDQGYIKWKRVTVTEYGTLFDVLKNG